MAELLAEEACLARNRGAVDRAGEAADKAVGKARIVDDGAAAGRHLAGIEAGHRPLAGLAADDLGGSEIAMMDAHVEVVVALHASAGAGDG